MEPGPQPHQPSKPPAAPPGSRSAARQAAIHWLARKLNPVEWTAEDERNLQQWILFHPVHQEEYLQAQATLAVMSHPGAFGADEIARVLAKSSRSDHPRRGPLLGLAAAAALTIVGAYVWLAKSSHSTHSTGVAETRLVTLPDGTTAHLDAKTTLRYEASTTARTVFLESGTAVFQISPSKTPFHVQAGDWNILDIGTTFQARLTSGPTDASSSTLEVSVAEGEVELRSRKYAQPSAVHLVAGEEIVWGNSSEAPARKSRADSPGEFALWREGRLRYRNQPLRLVLEDLQRYYPGKIVLTDPSLAQAPVTGTITTKDLPQAFQALEQILPLKFDTFANGNIKVLRK